MRESICGFYISVLLISLNLDLHRISSNIPLCIYNTSLSINLFMDTLLQCISWLLQIVLHFTWLYRHHFDGTIVFLLDSRILQSYFRSNFVL